MKDEDGKDLLLTTWIPKQMNEIFSNLKISHGKHPSGR